MKKALSLVLALVTLVCLWGCKGKPQLEPAADPIDDNYRVFYQIFVGSFSDSNSDGKGDLSGIIQRMDYLNDGNINSGESLGVQGLWLSPIFKSPSYHKYDVADYYQIDPRFGTQEDLCDLIAICHERNVKVIIDLPINHTSKNNQWFSEFCTAHKNGDTQNPYYDYYTYTDLQGCKGGHTYNIIQGCSNEYYECNFATDMPELNFDNQQVRQLVVDIAKYYLDLGVDGFRFDAIKYIYYADTQSSVDFWNWYMEQLRAIKPDIYCVGECWSGDAETLRYVQSLNCFDFQMAQAEGFIANAAKGVPMSTFTNYVEKYSGQVKAANPNGMMISFISNHDMDRSAGYLTMASKMNYMAANLYLLCCGSPFIYYGEEIGIKGSRASAQTDANRRVAMLWGDDDTIKDPADTTYLASKQTNGTVAEQLKNEDSLLNYYCRVIALRNKYPAIARGDYKAINYSQACFGGFLVSYQSQSIGIFHNTSEREVKIDLKSSQNTYDFTFTLVLDYIGQGTAQLEDGILTIGPQTSVIMG